MGTAPVMHLPLLMWIFQLYICHCSCAAVDWSTLGGFLQVTPMLFSWFRMLLDLIWKPCLGLKWGCCGQNVICLFFTTILSATSYSGEILKWHVGFRPVGWPTNRSSIITAIFFPFLSDLIWIQLTVSLVEVSDAQNWIALDCSPLPWKRVVKATTQKLNPAPPGWLNLISIVQPVLLSSL